MSSKFLFYYSVMSSRRVSSFINEIERKSKSTTHFLFGEKGARGPGLRDNEGDRP
jgi:hypothetical protein